MAIKKKKHDWNNLRNYLDVHESVLRKYASCFTNTPSYSVTRPTDQMLELAVTMHFSHKGLRLKVEKTAEIRSAGRGLESAKTYSYSYAAYDNTGCLFRYCSPHPFHNKFHHKHVYDEVTRVEVTPLKMLGEDEFPHVDEVIEELLKL
jgi:hypothetical protein